jgi:uncharacterized membrane protein YjjP (DUF1212 family)
MTPDNLANGARKAGTQASVPRLFRRGPWEAAAITLIAAGVLMLLQPFALALYTYSFVTTLAGVVLFTVVSKFPE